MKLKQLAVVQMGYSFRSRLEASAGGDIAVIQMKDLLQDNTVSCAELIRIDMKTVKAHHLTQKGDLVFRSRGQVTTSAILLKNPGNAVVAAPLLRIRVMKPDLILPDYLNWYINQKNAQIFLTSRARGTVQKMIGKQSIEDLEIPLPALKQQKNIADLANLSARESILLGTLAKKRQQYISTVLMQFVKGE